jgi:hypothetical protein
MFFGETGVRAAFCVDGALGPESSGRVWATLLIFTGLS